MFRSQFPNAPNLFSSYRRIHPPSVSSEFQRTWLTSIIGLVMVAAAVALLIWNEGRAVQTARSLEEGHSKVVIPETLDVVFEENNGKLVLLAGPISVEDALTDPSYGVSIRAVKLRKKVQMYQWYETVDETPIPAALRTGDHDSHSETTYSYDRGWFDYRIDSLKFYHPMGHHNPEFWMHNSSTIVNQRVKIGGFLLGDQLKEKFTEFTQFTSDERPANPTIRMHAGLYFHSKDVWEPDIGDVRVQFAYAGKDGEQVTVVGRQSGREIRPYKTEQGDELLILHSGLRKATEVFQAEHNINRIYLWLLRLFGWLVSFLGLNCLGTILDIIVDDSPGIRNILILGVTSLPFSFSLSISLLCIGTGWMLYRPILGISLLSLSLTPLLLAAFRIHQRHQLERRHRF